MTMQTGIVCLVYVFAQSAVSLKIQRSRETALPPSKTAKDWKDDPAGTLMDYVIYNAEAYANVTPPGDLEAIKKWPKPVPGGTGKAVRKFDLKFIKSLALMASQWHPGGINRKFQLMLPERNVISCDCPKPFLYDFPEKYGATCHLDIDPTGSTCTFMWDGWKYWKPIYENIQESFMSVPFVTDNTNEITGVAPIDSLYLYQYIGGMPGLVSVPKGTCVLSTQYSNDVGDFGNNGLLGIFFYMKNTVPVPGLFNWPFAPSPHFGCPDPLKNVFNTTYWISLGMNTEKISVFWNLFENQQLSWTIQESCGEGIYLTGYSLGGALAEMVFECPYMVKTYIGKPSEGKIKWESIFKGTTVKGVYPFDPVGSYVGAKSPVRPLGIGYASLFMAPPPCMPGWRIFVATDSIPWYADYFGGSNHPPARSMSLQDALAKSSGGEDFLYPVAGVCAQESVSPADAIKFYTLNPQAWLARVKFQKQQLFNFVGNPFLPVPHLKFIKATLQAETNTPLTGAFDGTEFVCDPEPFPPVDCPQVAS